MTFPSWGQCDLAYAYHRDLPHAEENCVNIYKLHGAQLAHQHVENTLPYIKYIQYRVPKIPIPTIWASMILHFRTYHTALPNAGKWRKKTDYIHIYKGLWLNQSRTVPWCNWRHTEKFCEKRHRASISITISTSSYHCFIIIQERKHPDVLG